MSRSRVRSREFTRPLTAGRCARARRVVEIYFSVVQRKVVSPDDFTDLAQVGNRLRAFWKFTTSDLDDLLARLDRHTADHQEESSVAPAA